MPSNSEYIYVSCYLQKNKKEEKDNACSSVHSILSATKKRSFIVLYELGSTFLNYFRMSKTYIFFKRNLMMKSGESQLIIY